MNHFILVLTLVVAAAAPSSLQAREDFFLKGGETVIFFGDSITQAGMYVEYVEAFLDTRFPAKTFRVLNRGISSETISGTSEPDHQPRRPDAQNRFARDIAAAFENAGAARNPRARIVVACFGMNDGNYFPFDADRFAKYRAGVDRLIARVRDEAHATLVILTPPPFDPYRRKASDPAARSFGYKFPALDYDVTLEVYSRWLLGLRAQGFVVADVHSAMNEHLIRRRAERVSFTLEEDAVHPNPTGHWIMAQTLLEAWHAPAVCAEMRINAAEPRVITGDVSNLGRQGGTLHWTWRTPLPMPIDPRWDRESVAIERVPERLNRYRLSVIHAPAARYRMVADGRTVAEVSREQLERGLDLLDDPAFPTNALSQEVLALVQERQKTTYDAWRTSIVAKLSGSKAEQKSGAERRATELDVKIRELCQPKRVAIQLVPREGGQ